MEVHAESIVWMLQMLQPDEVPVFVEEFRQLAGDVDLRAYMERDQALPAEFVLGLRDFVDAWTLSVEMSRNEWWQKDVVTATSEWGARTGTVGTVGDLRARLVS